MFTRRNLPALLFWVFVAGYAFVLVFMARLAPTDDYIFLRTLQVGKPILYHSADFPYYDSFAFGRLSPLVAMEYNFVGLFSTSPFWYFFVHAAELVILAYVMVRIIGMFTSRKLLRYGIPTLLFLSPGFALVWFRMQLDERNLLVLLSLFLLWYFAYAKTHRIRYLVGSVLIALPAIYSKETVFLLPGVFAFFHLLFSWKTSSRKGKYLDVALLLSSLSYLAVYAFYAIPRFGETLYNFTPYDPVLVFIKNLINYAFFSNPVMLLLIVPLFLVRAWAIIRRREKPHPIYDSMLAAVVAFIAAYFILNMYGPYYLIPAYIFAIPVLLHFFLGRMRITLMWKGLFAATAFVLIVNVIPLGIHYITYHKYLAVQYNAMLDFLTDDIHTRHAGERANIFLHGVARGASSRGPYYNLAEFLQYRGLGTDEFDLRSDKDALFPQLLISNTPQPFSVFDLDAPLPTITSGDYFIVSPKSTALTDDAFIDSLDESYELLFMTKSPLAFPRINAKSFVKSFILSRLGRGSGDAIVVNYNLSGSPDYRVYVRR